MPPRYNIVTVKDADGHHYRIYDYKQKRYFRRLFRTIKDALFFVDILNKVDRKITEGDPSDAQTETEKDQDDNE